MTSRLGVVFPGQGTQRNGMARDFCEASDAARAVLEECSDTLGLDLAHLCWQDDERLARTEYAQPAILAAEIAMTRALEQRHGLAPLCFGGHSLGEYTALVAAGVMEVGPTAALVRQRGRLMQEAAPLGAGAMVAVIQPDLDSASLSVLLEGSEVDIANLNSVDQAVISGPADEVAALAKSLRGRPGFERARCIPLKVSAPFHSRLMQPAAAALRPLLDAQCERWEVSRAAAVTQNHGGGWHEPSAESIRGALIAQVAAPVRWLDNMRALLERCDRIVELGPGRPLRGFFASLGVEIVSVATLEAADTLLATP